MKKNILIIGIGLIFVLVVVGVGLRYATNSAGTATTQPDKIGASPEPSPVAATPQAQVRVPFSENELLGVVEHAHTFTVTSGNKTTTVSFAENPTNSGRNPAYDVYVDQEKVDIKPGLIGGSAFSMLSTSPDKRYLAVRSMSSSCATCTGFGLYVVDLLKRKVIVLDPPHSDVDYTGNRSPYGAIIAYFNYSWNPDDSVKMTFFYVGQDKASAMSSGTALYRISPIEIWQYDPATASRSLVETKPE